MGRTQSGGVLPGGNEIRHDEINGPEYTDGSWPSDLFRLVSGGAVLGKREMGASHGWDYRHAADFGRCGVVRV